MKFCATYRVPHGNWRQVLQAYSAHSLRKSGQMSAKGSRSSEDGTTSHRAAALPFLSSTTPRPSNVSLAVELVMDIVVGWVLLRDHRRFLVVEFAERWIRLLISDVSGRNPSTVRACLGRRSGRSWDRKLAWIAHRPSQPREASFVVMGFQLWTFDKGATRFDDAPNVERLGPSLQRVVRSAWAARRRAIREGHGSRDAFVQADVAAFISTFMRIG